MAQTCYFQLTSLMHSVLPVDVGLVSLDCKSEYLETVSMKMYSMFHHLCCVLYLAVEKYWFTVS